MPGAVSERLARDHRRAAQDRAARGAGEGEHRRGLYGRHGARRQRAAGELPWLARRPCVPPPPPPPTHHTHKELFALWPKVQGRPQLGSSCMPSCLTFPAVHTSSVKGPDDLQGSSRQESGFLTARTPWKQVVHLTEPENACRRLTTQHRLPCRSALRRTRAGAAARASSTRSAGAASCSAGRWTRATSGSGGWRSARRSRAACAAPCASSWVRPWPA